MKLIRLISFLAIMFTFAFVENASASDIAIVNIKKIVDESSAAKNIAEQVEEKRSKFQAEVAGKEEKLHKEDKALAEQRAVLSKEVFEQKAKEFRSRVIDAQRIVQSRRAQLEKAYRKALEQVRNQTIEIIKDLSNKKNFSVALPKFQVLFSKDSMDISAEVLKQLNDKLPKVALVIED